MPQSKATWLVGLVGIAVIVVGIWWWSNMSGSTPVPLVANNNVGTASPEQPAQQTPGTTTGVAVQGNSDAALNSDLSKVDTQMNSMNSDSASIDQSMSDQPISQSY